MKIIDYNYYPIRQTYKIKSVNIYRNDKQDNRILSDNITFQGLPHFIGHGRISPDKLSDIANILKTLPETVKDETKNCSFDRIDFLHKLANKYNAKYFHIKDKDKAENPELVFKVFKQIKRPTKNHLKLIDENNMSFEEFSNILKKVTSKKELQLVTDIKTNEDYKEINRDTSFIFELLDLKNEDVINNFEKYKSYFILNKDNNSAVKELDEMLKAGTFDNKSYDKKLKSKTFSEYIPKLASDNENIITPEAVEENFSEQGYNLFMNMPNTTYLMQGLSNPDQESKKAIFNIFKTTNKKNFKDRKDIIKDYVEFSFTPSSPKDIYIHLDKLFTKMDKDTDARKFVKNYNKQSKSKSLEAEELNELLDNIPPKKLNIFLDNVINVIWNSKREKRIENLIKEIENPFFSANRHPQSSIFSRIEKLVLNKINKIRYHIATKFSKSETIATPNENIHIVPETIQESTQKINESTNVNKLTETILNNEQGLKPICNTQPIVDDSKDCDTLKIGRTIKSLKGSKLKIINDVDDVIKSKLSVKTYGEQSATYTKNATKIRLSLLPEMFASVKETRAIDRSVGKKKSNSANKDVLKLYERLNGNNRRLVNYMLKKRKGDGTRMFELKDIIDVIDNANNQIKKDSIDAKTYYKHLVDSNIEQYGKLARKKYKSPFVN